MKLESLIVEGMSCGHCASKVEKALNSIGASGNVDLAKNQVTVEYCESKLTLEVIKNVIETKGFKVI